MSREILEAMHALAREKGIEPEKLMIALEDALLSAYKKQPGSAKYARVEMDRETADFRVIELIIPERLEAHLIVETIDEETTIDPETGEMREPEEPEIDPEEVRRIPRPDRRARRHARRLRADRRADRQAGDPAAHPRGRARHDVRGVPRPRRRADHRHRAAVGLALHARAAARTRRGAAAEVRAGRGRALRPLPAHQGRHQGGLAVDQGAGDHRLPARPRADQEAVRARGARDRRRARGNRQRRARARLPLEDRRRSRTPTASTRSAPASARAARACAWSSPSCAARRSTSSPSTTSPRASSPRRSRPRACARCSSTTTPSRRP